MKSSSLPKKLGACFVSTIALVFAVGSPAHADFIADNGNFQNYSAPGPASCQWRVALFHAGPAEAWGDFTGTGTGSSNCSAVGVQVVGLTANGAINGTQLWDVEPAPGLGLAISKRPSPPTNISYGVNHWKFRLWVYSVLYQSSIYG
jgi:hypothetical protein